MAREYYRGSGLRLNRPSHRTGVPAYRIFRSCGWRFRYIRESVPLGGFARSRSRSRSRCRSRLLPVADAGVLLLYRIVSRVRCTLNSYANARKEPRKQYRDTQWIRARAILTVHRTRRTRTFNMYIRYIVSTYVPIAPKNFGATVTSVTRLSSIFATRVLLLDVSLAHVTLSHFIHALRIRLEHIIEYWLNTRQIDSSEKVNRVGLD